MIHDGWRSGIFVEYILAISAGQLNVICSIENGYAPPKRLAWGCNGAKTVAPHVPRRGRHGTTSREVPSLRPGDDHDAVTSFRDANLRWNSWALGSDMALFHIAMSLISSTTVLPTLIASLSHSEVIVGLASGLLSGAWLLPQLLVASAVSRLRLKKPLMVRAAWIGRPLILVLALILWFLGASHPQATLIALIAGMTGFWVVDAIVTTPWFDLLARAFPYHTRGRVLGAAQVVGGLGGIAGGMIVRLVLGEGFVLRSPRNYALLFGLSCLVFLASAVALSLIREPPPDPAQETRKVLPLRSILASLPSILLKDRAFFRLVLVRIVGGFVTIASAFYILHGTTNLGFGSEDTGLFVSAQVVGSLAAGLLMSTLQDRWGPLTHMRVVIVISALPPILALCAQPLVNIWPAGVLYLYLVLYFVLGIHMGSLSWPYLNWILEHAPDSQRPLYIGMINTLAATVMLAPVLGGWLVRGFSYNAAFAVALGAGSVAFILSLSLPDTRQQANKVQAVKATSSQS